MERNQNFLNITNFSESDLYIDDESFEQKGSNGDLSLLSMSWIESVEKELNVNEKQFIPINNKQIEKIKNIDYLILENYGHLSDINIIEYQTIIINYLKKIIKNTEKINIDDILLKLDWLLETSKYLSKKIGLIIFKHKNTESNSISRSSYKFCNYNFECQYNYNIKKHLGCFAQHYVHNLVYADIDSLKKFIISNKSKFNIILLDQIKKSINTITFVINHMFDELKNAQKYNFFNIDNIHVDRTPKKYKNKLTTKY